MRQLNPHATMDAGPASDAAWPGSTKTPAPSTDGAGDGLSVLVEWVHGNLHKQIGLEDMAKQAHVSRRTLVRRFHTAFAMSPIRWLQQERLRRAQQLLETTTMPIDRIAEQTGYGTATTLRRCFARQLTTTPSSYRRAFVRSERSGSRSDPTTPALAGL